jgi:hypothetical protein
MTSYPFHEGLSLAALSLKSRRIVLRLAKPTQDGDVEMSILTNLAETVADALCVARLYRNRWTLETPTA